VEVSAPAGELEVTGKARITIGVGEASAFDSLGAFSSLAVTGTARRALIGEDEAKAGFFSLFFTVFSAGRSNGLTASSSIGTAGSTLTNASSGGATVLGAGNPMIGRSVEAGARRE